MYFELAEPLYETIHELGIWIHGCWWSYSLLPWISQKFRGRRVFSGETRLWVLIGGLSDLKKNSILQINATIQLRYLSRWLWMLDARVRCVK